MRDGIACRYVRYLGCICGQGELHLDPDKVEAIKKMPTPTTTTEIKSFLGGAGFFRRWIADFSKITSPLTNLLKKGVIVKEAWTPACDAAVKTLKKAMTTYPVLRAPNPNLPFYLYTDASSKSLGAALVQVYEGKPCAVAYASRALQGAELNYDVREWEALGIVYGIKKFKHYLMCSPFTIRCLCDHRSLSFLDRGNTDMVGRIARWAIFLSDYKYKIEYLKGTSNSIADSLSRNTEQWAACNTAASLMALWPEIAAALTCCISHFQTSTNLRFWI